MTNQTWKKEREVLSSFVNMFQDFFILLQGPQDNQEVLAKFMFNASVSLAL